MENQKHGTAEKSKEDNKIKKIYMKFIKKVLKIIYLHLFL